MAGLAPDTRAAYDLLHGEIEELFDRKLSSLQESLTQTISNKLDTATTRFQTQIDELRDDIHFGAEGTAFDGAGGGLESQAPNSASKPSSTSPPAPSVTVAGGPSNLATGPDGHGLDKLHRGKGYVPYIPPPARGMRADPIHVSMPRFGDTGNSDTADVYGIGPQVELPRFDGSNPRLWQDRCEDYFQVWGTPQQLWIQYASARFDGAAAMA